MKILRRIVFLLLVSGVWCQNNRNAKAGGKPSKKSSRNQGGDVGQLTPVVNVTPGSTGDTGGTGATGGTGGTGSIGSSRVTGGARGTEVTGSARGSGGTGGNGGTGSSRGTGGVAEAGREGTARVGANEQETNILQLQFLKNTHVTCNDGTPAGFYFKESRGSRRWLLFLEAGWMCYDRETCDSRHQMNPGLMGSSNWPQTKIGGGIYSSQAEDNPYWYNANIVMIPYCSSDLWMGTRLAPRPRNGRKKERERNENPTEFSFMGSLIIREVIKDLIPKGIKLARVVMLSGTSAGGIGVFLNVDRLASQMEQLGSKAQVRGLVDSGWFLESERYKSPICPENVSCTTENNIAMGLRLWNAILPEKCLQLYREEPDLCLYGYNIYHTISSPLFIIQWLFDSAQLKWEKITIDAKNLSQEQWLFFRNMGTNLRHSMINVTALFAGSCFAHSVLYDNAWVTYHISGTSLPRAVNCWERSLEATRNNRTPAKGCPFHLIDTCQWPQCNPTCPPLVDPIAEEQITLLQMLESMGLDLQKLGLDLQEDLASLVSMSSNDG